MASLAAGAGRLHLGRCRRTAGRLCRIRAAASDGMGLVHRYAGADRMAVLERRRHQSNGIAVPAAGIAGRPALFTAFCLAADLFRRRCLFAAVPLPPAVSDSQRPTRPTVSNPYRRYVADLCAIRRTDYRLHYPPNQRVEPKNRRIAPSAYPPATKRADTGDRHRSRTFGAPPIHPAEQPDAAQ